MGLGSSKPNSGYKRRNLSPRRNAGGQAGRRRRGGFLRKIRLTPTTQFISPSQYHVSNRYSYGSQYYGSRMPAYIQHPLSYPMSVPKPYNNYSAGLYNNYGSYPFNNYAYNQYGSSNQPMIIQQPLSQYPPGMISPQAPFMIIPQQAPLRVVPPYVSSPHGTNIPYAPYNLQNLSNYNNIGVSTPIMPGMVNPFQMNPSQYRGRSEHLFTDWTGGGQNSPGFLGPPI